jgi:hypothetical protein
MDGRIHEDRVAFGLVLYESTKQPGKFHRVGAFLSDPVRGGGLGAFSNVAAQSIEII